MDSRDAKTIAAAAGLSPGTLTNWRKGDRQPKADELYRLARVLGVSMESLITDSPQFSTGASFREIPPEYKVDDLLRKVDDLLETAAAIKVAAQRLKEK